MKAWISLFAILLLSSSSFAQDYEREKRWAAEVVPNLVVGDAVQLKLPSGREFLGIHVASKAAKNAILLVHGLGVHPDHGVIGILRASLADLGYATLAIQMPVQKSEATADDYRTVFPEAAARIDAGGRWLAANGYPHPVLLSHSLGARMANAYYERTALVPAAVPFSAWISLGITVDYGRLDEVKVPILDVYGENDFAQVLAATPRRRTAIAGIAGSRQVVIAGADHYYTGRERELAAVVGEFLAPLNATSTAAGGQGCPAGDLVVQQRQEKECRASGGEWAKFGIRAHLCGTYSCAPRTADGGKPCRNRAECEYLCVSRKPAALGTEVAGECAAVRTVFGCNYQVDGGRIVGYVCVD